MSEKRELPATLVIAEDVGVRRRVCGAVEALGEVEGIPPSALQPASRYVDVPAILLAARASDAAVGPGGLAGVEMLPGWTHGVLLTQGLEGEALEQLLSRLRPAHVLSADADAALLRYVVGRLHEASPGRGARDQHRPARAILGVSAAIRDLVHEIRQVATSLVPVLINGETGTGKELVARAIHQQGPRAARPFVAVNCGALPDSLLEAELFGFERGAFTGAERAKPGLFEEADGGTLFLDEIGDTTPALQMKLLRAIEEGEIRRLGDTSWKAVDVRVVSATHRDLDAAVDAGSFRQDLLYRLNTYTLNVPPLRRRRVDIPFLAQHFAEEFGAAHTRRIALSEEFVEALSRHDFPGNVRELRNAVERAITSATPGRPVTVDHLPKNMSGPPALLEIGTLRDRVMQVELHAIQEALERFEGNRTRAAAALGLSRVGLRNKMQRLGLG